MHRYKTKFTSRFTLLLLISGLLWQAHRYPAAVAQGYPPEEYRIHVGSPALVNISWANDSSSLVFQEDISQNVRSLAGVHSEGVDTWHQYHVTTGQTTYDDYWPLQPELSAAQWDDFEIFQIGDDLSSFLFESPDAQYIVYPALNRISGSTRLPLGVANLDTGQHQVLDDVRGPNTPNFRTSRIDESYVYWNSDSSAFAFQAYHSGRGLLMYYVSNLTPDLTGVKVQELREGLSVGGNTFYPSQVFDAHGDYLLLEGAFENSDTEALLLWNATSTSGAIIPVEGRVAGATFYGEGVDNILFVDSEGLKQFSTNNLMVSLFNPEITSTWAAGGAYFSPNSDHLAIYDGGEDGPNRIYLFELSTLTDLPAAD